MVRGSFVGLRALWLVAALVCASPSRALAINRDGRPQALLVATGFGLYEGIAASMLLDDYKVGPTDGRKQIALYSLITLVTTAGSYAIADAVTNRYGVNRAQASVINSSFFWALLNGTSLSVEADFNSPNIIWSTLLSGWAGQGLGILLASNTNRSPGQLDFMNSVSVWSGAETALLMNTLDHDFGKNSRLLTVPALVADITLLGTGYATRRMNISSSRVRLLDLGGLCGGLAGPAALFMIWGPEDDLRVWYGTSVAVGIAAGLVTAWTLTRNTDAPSRAASPTSAASAQQQQQQQAVMLPLYGAAF